MDIPEGGQYVGLEAVALYTRDLLKPWTGFTMGAEEILAAGDSVLVSVHQHAVGSISGVPAEMRYFTLWSFRGRKVIRIESFRERHEALDAAGLSEKAMPQGNVEIVRRLAEAFQRRQHEWAFDFYDPSIEWDASHTPSGAAEGVYCGHEGVLAALAVRLERPSVRD